MQEAALDNIIENMTIHISTLYFIILEIEGRRCGG
jgi:hypothetical protein